MKKLTGLLVLTAALLQTPDIMAGTFPAGSSRQPLVQGSLPQRLSIGIDYDVMERDVDIKNGGKGTLEADRINAYVGFDALPWLTTFVTVGGVEVDGPLSKTGLAVSVGLGAYLWEADIVTPSFMAGRITIKASAELGRYESEVLDNKIRWTEGILALPFGYEKFESQAIGLSTIQTGLALYAGPAVSIIDGKSGSGASKVDFSEDEVFGVVGGADVYFTRHLSIGVSLRYFDELSYGASLRYHF